MPVKELAKYATGAVFLVGGLTAGYLDLKDGTPSGVGVGEVGGLLFIAGILIDPALTKQALAVAVDSLREFFGKDHDPDH